MRRRLVLFGCLLLVASCASIIGIDRDYVETADDAGALDGAGSDGALAEADGGEASTGTPADGGCAGHICDGQCLPGDDCSDCRSGTLFCASTRACVSACSGCSRSVECWSCPSSTARRVGSCEPTESAYCLGASYPHCACTAGVDECPGAHHLCVGALCVSCGAAGSSTDGKPCTGGLTCESEKRRCHD